MSSFVTPGYTVICVVGLSSGIGGRSSDIFPLVYATSLTFGGSTPSISVQRSQLNAKNKLFLPFDIVRGVPLSKSSTKKKRPLLVSWSSMMQNALPPISTLIFVTLRPSFLPNSLIVLIYLFPITTATLVLAYYSVFVFKSSTIGVTPHEY